MFKISIIQTTILKTVFLTLRNNIWLKKEYINFARNVKHERIHIDFARNMNVPPGINKNRKKQLKKDVTETKK